MSSHSYWNALRAKIVDMLQNPQEHLGRATDLPFPINRHVRKRLGIRVFPTPILVDVPAPDAEDGPIHKVKITETGRIATLNHDVPRKVLWVFAVLGQDLGCECMNLYEFIPHCADDAVSGAILNISPMAKQGCSKVIMTIHLIRATRAPQTIKRREEDK